MDKIIDKDVAQMLLNKIDDLRAIVVSYMTPTDGYKVTPKDEGCITDWNGNKCWYKNGLLHRENGPAVVCKDGGYSWYKNGTFHREDGPAVEYADGTKYWYKDGLFHNDNGPAIVTITSKEWWINGKLHREDGPAIEYSSGGRFWYLHNEVMSEAMHKEKTEERVNKEKVLERDPLERDRIIPFTDCFGSKHYYDKNGDYHRSDGPSYISCYGGQCWHKHGRFHRLDGPAIVYENGEKSWFIEGDELTEQEHKRIAATYKGTEDYFKAL